MIKIGRLVVYNYVSMGEGMSRPFLITVFKAAHNQKKHEVAFMLLEI